MGSPGFEPGTSRSSVGRSPAKLRTQKKTIRGAKKQYYKNKIYMMSSSTASRTSSGFFSSSAGSSSAFLSFFAGAPSPF
jgi:hypothetical protein